MRISHVVENLNRGGLERVVLDLVREQAALSHACQVLCLFERGHLADELTAAGVEVVACGKHRGLDARALRRLRDAIRAHGAEIVHSHNAMAHYYAVAATLFLGVRRINTRHGMGNFPCSIRRELLFRLSLVATHSVVAVCVPAFRNFVRYRAVPPSKMVVIHNGIQIDQFHVGDSEARNDLRRMLGWGESAVVLGCVARLNAAKDHETLLRALQMVRVHYPQAGLVLVGDGALRASLEALSADLKLDQAVRFLGDRGDVAELVRGFDLFVLSSLTEGYSIALIEACAAGVPIVATRVGGNGEIVYERRNGLLVESRAPQAFAQAVQSLLADANTRARMASESRRLAEQYGSVKSMSARYLDLYRGHLPVDRSVVSPTGIA